MYNNALYSEMAPPMTSALIYVHERNAINPNQTYSNGMEVNYDLLKSLMKELEKYYIDADIR